MSSKEIVFIDDDVSQIQTWADVFSSKGFSCKIIRDATQAFDYLSNNSNLKLVIIDVMLAARSPGHEQRYTAKETGNYMETGIVLYKELKDGPNPLFPERAILISHTDKRVIIDKARAIAKDDDVLFLRKADIMGPYDLYEKVTSYLKKIEK